MRDPALRTFDDFWPFSVGQHRGRATRVMHFIGATGAFVMWIPVISAGSAVVRLPSVAEVERPGYGPAPISA